MFRAERLGGVCVSLMAPVCLLSVTPLSFLAKGMCSCGQGPCQVSRQLPAPAGPGTGGLEPGEVCKRQPLCSPGLARAKLCDPCGFLQSLAGRGKVREEREERQTDIHTAEREQGKIGKERDRDTEREQEMEEAWEENSGETERSTERNSKLSRVGHKGQRQDQKAGKTEPVHRPHLAICQPLIPDA